MLKSFKAAFILTVFILFSCQQNQRDSVSLVDPFIGTGGHGHTYPGATLPFGMVQLSPDTRLDGWDGCSGYHYSDSVIYGFSHTALSGTGVADYNDVLVMPGIGDPQLDYGYGSKFNKESEKASPGYYKVMLSDNNVLAELTASCRAGFHKYTFPENENSYILFDLKHRDTVLDSKIKIVNDHEIEGFRRSNAWARDQHIYFVARFSKPFRLSRIAVDDKFSDDCQTASGKNLKAIFTFSTDENEVILVKVGISAVSIAGARSNLDTEIPDWNFAAVRKKAARVWNDELGCIKVSGSSKQDRIKFYSALYHSFLAPNVFMDVDGKYRGTDHKIHQTSNYVHHTVFSLWDTFRGEHPLFTIIQQKRTNDFINTFISQYEQGGQLPVWELAANYTGCMIGYHSIPVIVDAYKKGIRNYNVGKIYKAMTASADADHLGLAEYREYGYIPGDKEAESVSKTLEYAYDDWCIAQMAKSLDKKVDYKRFIRRAQFYKNIYDKSTGFMRGKQNGTWHEPFDPTEVNFYFTEANSWQYSFFVPQDIQGMINMMGGQDKFINKLDGLFEAESHTTGRQQSDITGLIGQYAHGNEPSHHMAYLYNYAGQPWKAQKLVRRIMNDLYTVKPDGLAGNEDCGQMSAWFVLSSMGFYPVTPGEPIYAIGSPFFDKVDIKLENGKVFSIEAKNNSKENIYIQSASLNGKALDRNYLKQADIMQGGRIIFKMGKDPNKEWGSSSKNRKLTNIKDFPVLISPSITQGQRTFFDAQIIALTTAEPAGNIYYTLDGSNPDENDRLYDKPFKINGSTIVKAVTCKDGFQPSYIMTAEFNKVPQARKIEIFSTYDNQYTGGGDIALIDFIRGGNDFRNHLWQGYEGQDFTAIVDLGKIEKISSIGAGFFQDVRSWIWLPESVRFSISDNGKKFKEIKFLKNTISQDRYGAIQKDFMATFPVIKTRYVKVEAKNMGKVPEWHAGAGGKSWIFIDEIIVE